MKVGRHGRRSRGMQRAHVMLLTLLTVAALLVAVPAPANAGQQEQGQPAVQWQAAINGRPVDQIDPNAPLQLHPEEGAVVELTLTNSGQQQVDIRSVRLDGSVMGLTMYNFTTRIDLVMPPNTTTTRRIDVDLIDLSGQATGLIPSRLLLLDDERNVLQEAAFPADIRGSISSVYGVFGLAVLGITLVMLASLLLAIRGSQLPENRWRRAMRFVPVGIGVGLVLTFTLSATRQLSPDAVSWTTVVLLCAAGALVLGYFLPLGVAEEETADGGEYAEASVEEDDGSWVETGDGDGVTEDEEQPTMEQPAGWWRDAPEVSNRDRTTTEGDW